MAKIVCWRSPQKDYDEDYDNDDYNDDDRGDDKYYYSNIKLTLDFTHSVCTIPRTIIDRHIFKINTI